MRISLLVTQEKKLGHSPGHRQLLFLVPNMLQQSYGITGQHNMLESLAFVTTVQEANRPLRREVQDEI